MFHLDDNVCQWLYPKQELELVSGHKGPIVAGHLTSRDSSCSLGEQISARSAIRSNNSSGNERIEYFHGAVKTVSFVAADDFEDDRSSRSSRTIAFGDLEIQDLAMIGAPAATNLCCRFGNNKDCYCKRYNQLLFD